MYFLGNIPSHVSHALPIFAKMGGEFVVTSKNAQKYLHSYGISATCIDDAPFVWQRGRFRPQRLREYTSIDARFSKTVDYLCQADVVIFYELFEFSVSDSKRLPLKIFLTHGNMLKNYMTMKPSRLETIKKYDFMASIGPYLHKKLLNDGVSEDQLAKLGIARTDNIIKNRNNHASRKQLVSHFMLDPAKPIISYVPTYWGASSIYGTGLELMRNMSMRYNVLFRPHPQTPKKILHPYLAEVKRRSNLYYAPGSDTKISLIDLMCGSDLIIGDVSSVMLEAIVAEKPLVFAFGAGTHRQHESDYEAISNIVSVSSQIDAESAATINEKVQHSLATSIDTLLWRKAEAKLFYAIDGTATDGIISFISQRLSGKETP